MATDTAPPVLSFPAILRNPGLTSRFAHLQHGPGTGSPLRQQQAPPAPKKKHRDQNEGKRWVRRKDNSRFVGNPHIVPASRRDFAIPQPEVKPTFPEPLPYYLQRTVKLPTAPAMPVTDPASANAGRFAHSLKGMRKDLRRAGGRAQALVRDVEQELVEWLARGGTVLAPDLSRPSAEALLQEMGVPVGNTGTIFEVSRTPLQLVWRIADDSFARYVVHCCARYHEVVSFSKGTGEERLTYLLRPNVTRPDRRAAAALETPPVTDIDYSSNPETDDAIDSDFISDREMDSDAELEPRMGRLRLTSIEESPAAGVPLALPLVSEGEEEGWSHVEDSEFDDFESGSEFGSASVEFLQPRMHALHIHEQSHLQQEVQPGQPEADAQPVLGDVDDVMEDADKTITDIRAANSPLRRRDWAGVRSPSSPSRSPARSRPSRRRGRHGAKKHHPATALADGRSFYDYLFL